MSRKNLISKLAVCLAIVSVFASCTTTNKGFQSSPVISRNVELDPIKADIKVDQSHKLTGESSSSYFLIFRVEGDNTFADGIYYSSDSGNFLSRFNPMVAWNNKVRAAAAYKALSQGDYDVLVHPSYTMTVTNFLGIYKMIKCTVTGYGAKYENFRTEKQKVIISSNSKEYIFPEK